MIHKTALQIIKHLDLLPNNEKVRYIETCLRHQIDKDAKIMEEWAMIKFTAYTDESGLCATDKVQILFDEMKKDMAQAIRGQE